MGSLRFCFGGTLAQASCEFESNESLESLNRTARGKNPDQVGFAVQPRRRVVERFFACRNRRIAKGFEATIASARAFLYAAVMLLVRRLACAS